MNILVTGANGQLGNEMRIVTKKSADKYIFTDVMEASEESIAMLKKLGGEDIKTDTEFLDITDLTDIRLIVRKYDVKVIVNCAAYTNVDAAESNEALAEKLNVSRQVVVTDIALIRANGVEITSTNRGYVITNTNKCKNQTKNREKYPI